VAADGLAGEPISEPTPTRRLALAYPSDRPISRVARAAGELLKSITADFAERGFWSARPRAGSNARV
jgi:hypothetical protein